LNESPTHKVTLVDITCDSDGIVEKFVDLKDIKDAIEVHPLRDGEPYYLAFVLVGAYQDTMGDMHNLFGRVHEAEVLLDPRGKAVIRSVRRGEPGSETLACFGYEQDELVESVASGLREKTARGEMSREAAAELVNEYRQKLAHYTYLD
jgi:arginine decarboxylase